MKRYIFVLYCILGSFSAYAQLNTDRIMNIGKNALFSDEYVLSIQYFNQVISTKPYLSEPYRYRSFAKIQLEDYLGAELDCNKSLEINPFKPTTYFYRSYCRANQNKLSEALLDINKAIEFNPNDTLYIAYRLAIKEELKDYHGALEDVNLLYKLQPKRHKLLYAKGNYFLQLKDTANAISVFKKCTKVDEMNYLGWSALGLIKMQQNDKIEAMNFYNQSISRNSKYGGDYINRGNLNKNLSNFKLALSDYDQAVKYDSLEVLGYYNRGLLLLYLGDENRALSDFRKTVKLDSTNYEARLNKAYLEYKIDRNYKQAINDYKFILQKYPYYIPAIEGIAKSEQALGNNKQAYIYNQQIKLIESNKNYYKQKTIEKIESSEKGVHTIQNNNLHIIKKKNKIFEEFNPNYVDSIDNNISGKVQNKNVNVINENNFSFNSLTVNKLTRRTNLSISDIDQINSLNIAPLNLTITNNDIPLLPEVINMHFNCIKIITDSLTKSSNQVEKYFIRGVEFSLVKDYIGALNDFDKVVELNPTYALGYFSRANIRLKMSNGEKSKLNTNNDHSKNELINGDVSQLEYNTYIFDYQTIIDDFNKTIELSPDFSFAYYNKANILCTQKDFNSAISNYTKAIEIDPDFAEAYFNRGLTYLFTGEDAKGLADLSKAGELGIYKAYNLIQRFKK